MKVSSTVNERIDKLHVHLKTYSGRSMGAHKV